MRQRTTISTVAKACGVSKAAVSLALRGSNQVSPRLREKTLQVAQELGYVPSRAARQLNGQGSQRIGVVLSLPGSPMESMLLRKIEEICRARGVETAVRYHYWHTATERQILQSLFDDGISGLMLIPASTTTGEMLCQLQQAGLSSPLVTHGTLGDAGKELAGYLGNFAPDLTHIARTCIRHVVGAGHRHIAVLFQGPQIACGGSSLLARSFLLAAGDIPEARIEMFYLDDSSSPIRQKILRGEPCGFADALETDKQLADHFLNHPFEASVAITSDDLTALCLLNACFERKVKVPDDLSIFSLGGSEVCRMTALPLDHAAADINSMAARITGKLLGNVVADHEEIVYPLNIIPGATLARHASCIRVNTQRKTEQLPQSSNRQILQQQPSESLS